MDITENTAAPGNGTESPTPEQDDARRGFPPGAWTDKHEAYLTDTIRPLITQLEDLRAARKVLPFQKPAPDPAEVAKSIQAAVEQVDTSLRAYIKLYMEHELALMKMKTDLITALGKMDKLGRVDFTVSL